MNVLKTINIGVGLSLIIVLTVAGIYLQKLLQHDTINTIFLKADKTCDLGRQSCSAHLGKKSVSVLFVRPVRYLEKVELEVTTTGFDDTAIKKMLIDFSMPDMQMGINRFALAPSQTGNRWQGMAILPVCASGRIDWQVQIYLQTNEQRYAAVFTLTVEN